MQLSEANTSFICSMMSGVSSTRRTLSFLIFDIIVIAEKGPLAIIGQNDEVGKSNPSHFRNFSTS
jgi:hypothetical protein